MAVSTRTCIGCRQRAAASELVRLVMVGGRLRVGARTGQAGRGASIHPREACVAAASKTHAFSRAFRGPVSLFHDGEGSDASRGDDALRELMRKIEVAHVSQQPRAGRTP